MKRGLLGRSVGLLALSSLLVLGMATEENWLQASDGSLQFWPESRHADDCGWSEGFHSEDLGNVYATTMFDDGNGPALFVGGNFDWVGGVTASNVARFDGTVWSNLTGPSGEGTDGQVNALTVFDDGTGPALYAGGNFTTAGGISTNGVARWDGTAWSALEGASGTGVSDIVVAMAVYDDGHGEDLYVAGYFVSAGGVSASRIARWDGSEWSPLFGPSSNGTSNYVRSLQVHDDGSGPSLFVGGQFTTAGGIPSLRIARWDGVRWWPVGPGFDAYVGAFAVFDEGEGPRLFAGGAFRTGNGDEFNYVARWDGSEWTQLSGPSGIGVGPQYSAVRALGVHDDGSGPALFAGGWFQTAGGVPSQNVARWDGSAWSSLSGPLDNGMNQTVETLTTIDAGSGEELLAGGLFTRAGGTLAYYLARWTGTEWSAFSEPPRNGMTGTIDALGVFDEGSGQALIAGGNFAYAGVVPSPRLARWDGTEWSALPAPSGFGVDTAVSTLQPATLDSQRSLFIGGKFTSLGALAAAHIARWDGAEWFDVAGGMNDQVTSLVVFNDGGDHAVYAGGFFTTAGGFSAQYVARWDGTEWSPLTGSSGNEIGGAVHALGAFDDGVGAALFVGGTFISAGGLTANNIARWDGAEWSNLTGPFGEGADGQVSALAVYDDGTGPALYVGGSFEEAGGLTANNIARWDGTTWAVLGGAFEPGVSGPVEALYVWNDGTGSALYVTGQFWTAGGETANSIARWDGVSWTFLDGATGVGFNINGNLLPSGRALAVVQAESGSSLYVGGRFDRAGGELSSNIGMWNCSSPIFSDGFESGDIGNW